MRYLVSALMGLAAGSFSNVCVIRLPQDQSVWFPRSHCPKCGRTLQYRHNIPIVSFAALKGRCYDCRAPIAWQYPLIEAFMACFFIFHAWYFAGSRTHMALADVLSFYLLTISIIDYRHRIIPDELSLSMLAIGLMVSFGNPYLPGPPWIKFFQSAAAALSGGLLALLLAYAGEKIFTKEALGGGDIKLIAASAAVFGWAGIAGPLFLGSLSGGLMALILLILKKKKLGETLPFGPFLSLGIYFTCFFPGWWVSLFHL